MALLWRIWGTVTIVALVVLGIFVGLATLQFGSIHATLVGERLVVLADRTVAPFAAAVRLGLPLAGVRNAKALLERARQSDEDIVALHVFDSDGRIVHSTAPTGAATIPPQAVAARTAARGAPWYLDSREGFLGSVDIAGGDGGSAGGILIVYPRGGHLTQVRAMFAAVVLGALLTLLLAGVLGALLLRWGLRTIIRQFDAIDAGCRDFERGAWRRAAGADAPGQEPDTLALRERLEAAAARYRETGQQLAAARGRPSS